MASERKRGRPSRSRVKVDRKRFDEALEYAHTDIKTLSKSRNYGLSPNAIYKQLNNKDGMHAELLYSIAKDINVDPDYIMGTYNSRYSYYKGISSEKILKIMLNDGRFPYKEDAEITFIKTAVDYKKYYETIIPAHGISFESFEKMPFKERLDLQKKIEDALGRVFRDHFGSDDPEKYEYLTWFDFDQIEEIYDWFGLDEIVETNFLSKLHKCRAVFDEYEQSMMVEEPFGELLSSHFW